MAKKTLKKSKKIQATKPLMAPGFKKEVPQFHGPGALRDGARWGSSAF